MRTPEGLIDAESHNATVAWALVALLIGLAAVTAIDGDLLWAGLALTIVVVALVPVVVIRDHTLMVSWEALALATIPIVAHVLEVFAEPLGYVAVATIALLLAVEIAAFSTAEMTPWFAVAFVVMTTMSAAATWGIARYASDELLGTSFLTGNADLMWNLVGATAVGILAGLAFELYFRRRSTGYGAAIEGE